MDQVAENVFILKGFPKYGINIYLVGDVLLDAGTRWATRRILRQIQGREVKAHALTHAHPDHQGASHAVCSQLNLPLWCGADDADAMDSGDFSKVLPCNWNTHLQHLIWTGPGHPVDRRLHDGDEVADFTIVDAPGHSPGQVAYWRESDRLLILGDVLNGISLLTGQVGLHEPPVLFTVDPAVNRQSARKLAQLEPKTICFGHGPPWRDSQAFQEFVATLPE